MRTPVAKPSKEKLDVKQAKLQCEAAKAQMVKALTAKDLTEKEIVKLNQEVELVKSNLINEQENVDKLKKEKLELVNKISSKKAELARLQKQIEVVSDKLEQSSEMLNAGLKHGQGQLEVVSNLIIQKNRELGLATNKLAQKKEWVENEVFKLQEEIDKKKAELGKLSVNVFSLREEAELLEKKVVKRNEIEVEFSVAVQKYELIISELKDVREQLIRGKKELDKTKKLIDKESVALNDRRKEVEVKIEQNKKIEKAIDLKMARLKRLKEEEGINILISDKNS